MGRDQSRLPVLDVLERDADHSRLARRRGRLKSFVVVRIDHHNVPAKNVPAGRVGQSGPNRWRRRRRARTASAAASARRRCEPARSHRRVLVDRAQLRHRPPGVRAVQHPVDGVNTLVLVVVVTDVRTRCQSHKIADPILVVVSADRRERRIASCQRAVTRHMLEHGRITRVVARLKRLISGIVKDRRRVRLNRDKDFAPDISRRRPMAHLVRDVRLTFDQSASRLDRNPLTSRKLVDDVRVVADHPMRREQHLVRRVVGCRSVGPVPAGLEDLKQEVRVHLDGETLVLESLNRVKVAGSDRDRVVPDKRDPRVSVRVIRAGEVVCHERNQDADVRPVRVLRLVDSALHDVAVLVVIPVPTTVSSRTELRIIPEVNVVDVVPKTTPEDTQGSGTSVALRLATLLIARQNLEEAFFEEEPEQRDYARNVEVVYPHVVTRRKVRWGHNRVVTIDHKDAGPQTVKLDPNARPFLKVLLCRQPYERCAVLRVVERMDVKDEVHPPKPIAQAGGLLTHSSSMSTRTIGADIIGLNAMLIVRASRVASSPMLSPVYGPLSLSCRTVVRSKVVSNSVKVALKSSHRSSGVVPSPTTHPIRLTIRTS